MKINKIAMTNYVQKKYSANSEKQKDFRKDKSQISMTASPFKKVIDIIGWGSIFVVVAFLMVNIDNGKSKNDKIDVDSFNKGKKAVLDSIDNAQKSIKNKGKTLKIK